MNLDISIDVMGINTEHNKDYVVDRPNGTNYYVLMNFLNPVYIKTIDGFYNCEGGECIIHSKDFHEYHRAANDASDGFMNNWVHFDSKNLDSIMVHYQLEYDKIYKVPKKHSPKDYFEELEIEHLERKPFHEENNSIIIEKILLTIARNQKHEHMISNLSHYEMMHFYAFNKIRQTALDDFSGKWTIKKMANIANVSENRFSVLYKKFFNTSPIDDLINRRINRAKTLLLDTDNTIDDISVLCGFASQSYFSRTFKAKTGESPNDFRKPQGRT